MQLIKIFKCMPNRLSLWNVSSRWLNKPSVAPDLIQSADDAIHRPFKDSDDAVERFCSLLLKSSVDCRVTLLRHLAKTHGIDFTALKNVSSRWISDTSLVSDIAAAKRISDAGLPGYKYFFEKVARNAEGIRVLVDLRNVLIGTLLENKVKQPAVDDNEKSQLKFMSGVLRELFMLWFSPALLQLQRLSWESTPASLLESVARSQAVVPVRNWLDLKRRLNKTDRSCFVFTHPALSSIDPVIILYVALMPTIPHCREQITGRTSHSIENATSSSQHGNKAAIFYSISSQHKGLNGIDLGHNLIRRVMSVLRSESPEVTEFSTLSPVPGFIVWLKQNINTIKCSAGLRNTLLPLLEKLEDPNAFGEHFRGMLQKNLLSNDSNECKELLRLMARYLCIEKHRGFALDAVAHFHLRNGAEIWRINWLGDVTAKGFSQSASIMVNYRYWPEKLHRNAHLYAVDRKVALSSDVETLL